MAESYEYPPSLTNYRPLHFDRAGYHPTSLKLRHHFFITRAKIVLKEIFLVDGGDQMDAYLQEEIHNVLISQGWCAALGVPVPIPFFLQEYLLGTFDDPGRASRHIPSLVKIFLTLEISELDCKFHEDIMGGDGKWWRTEGAKPPSFNFLWKRLGERSMFLANAGAFGGKQSDALAAEDIIRISDPTQMAGKEASASDMPKMSKGKGKKKAKRSSQDHSELLRTLSLPDVHLSEQDMDDLDRIAELTYAETQLVRLMSIEAETVETEKWNRDAVSELLTLSVNNHNIPFGTREELFDLRPTANDDPVGQTIGKGKKRAVDNPPPKRSIYHLLPADGKESWLGRGGGDDPLPPFQPAEKIYFSKLVKDTLPEVFADDAPHHHCIYRELAKRFVTEDVQKMSTRRLGEFLAAQKDVIGISLASWPTLPPLGDLPIDEQLAGDPVSRIFKQMVAVSECTVPPNNTPRSRRETSSESEAEEGSDSSEWESEVSAEEDTAEILELDADMGDITFATSNTI